MDCVMKSGCLRCFPAHTMTTTVSVLDPLLTLSYKHRMLFFDKIPGSNVIVRYVKSSHQNDPGRTVLEILLALPPRHSHPSSIPHPRGQRREKLRSFF